jgi:hypothetical protein
MTVFFARAFFVAKFGVLMAISAERGKGRSNVARIGSAVPR